MKRTVVFALVIALSSLCAFAEEPGGAGELNWGDPLPERFDAVPVDNFLRDAAYTDPEDRLSFHGVPLVRAEYEFRNGELSRAAFYFQGGKAYKAQKEALESECQRVSTQMQQLRAFVAKKRTEVLEAKKQ